MCVCVCVCVLISPCLVNQFLKMFQQDKTRTFHRRGWVPTHPRRRTVTYCPSLPDAITTVYSSSWWWVNVSTETCTAVSREWNTVQKKCHLVGTLKKSRLPYILWNTSFFIWSPFLSKSIKFDLQSRSICFNLSFKLVYTVHRISAHTSSVDPHHMIIPPSVEYFRR
jgi:hypothetical protein